MRQRLPYSVTFTGPLRISGIGVVAPEENQQQVFVLSYAWHTTFPADEKIGVHPDPHQYYLERVKYALRLYAKHRSRETYLFWDWMSLFQEGLLTKDEREGLTLTKEEREALTDKERHLLKYGLFRATRVRYKGHIIVDGARSDAQQKAFDKCVDTIDLWFGISE